jgi:hypothetical protein
MPRRTVEQRVISAVTDLPLPVLQGTGITQETEREFSGIIDHITRHGFQLEDWIEGSIDRLDNLLRSRGTTSIWFSWIDSITLTKQRLAARLQRFLRNLGS